MPFPFAIVLVVMLAALVVLELCALPAARTDAPWPALERGRVWTRRVAFLAGVLFLVLALHPRIALGQVTPADPPPPATLTPMQWVVTLAAIAGAFGTLMTAIGEALKLLGMKYPALEQTAEHFLAFGIDLRKAAALAQVKTAAKRAALASAAWENRITSSPPPPPPVVPPFPPTPPANGFIRRELLGPLTAAGLLFLAGCSWFQAHPTVAKDTRACINCVGTDAVKNETSATPLPFYPQFCTELLDDCGSLCGTDVVDVISALAGATDPAVQKTRSFREASARKGAMLAPSPKAP